MTITLRRFLVAAVIALPVLASSAAHSSAGALSGLGEVTPPGCDSGALKMPITSVSDSGALWVSVRAASIAVDCPAIVYGLTMAFAGYWNPATGGCLWGVTHSGSRLCLGAVPSRLTVQTVSMALCFWPATCWQGAATVLRA